ncbi:hypothetical protein [Pseudomonas typographi]|uniref:hypothetical protein n=1 Tax=Pseudomonas typographi TaxID=2715964 RepID=UPI001683321D|nr:hypothetical protein [Pseudomonas typographi]MBD1586540.1 hypothetical protein [Pseudomonas typographi]
MQRNVGAVALLALALAGCAGYKMDHTRDVGPIGTLESARPPQELAQCVEATWQSEALFGAVADAFTERAGNGQYTVSDHASDYFVDINPNGPGSVLRFYGNPRSGEVAQKRQATVATCL